MLASPGSSCGDLGVSSGCAGVVPKGVWWTLLPHILLGVGALLALRFGSSRVFAVACLAWFGINALITASPHDSEPLLAFAAIALLLASLMPERGVFVVVLIHYVQSDFSSGDLWLLASGLAGAGSRYSLFIRRGLHAVLDRGIHRDCDALRRRGPHSSISSFPHETPIDCGLFGTTIAWVVLVVHSGPHTQMYSVCLAFAGFPNSTRDDPRACVSRSINRFTKSTGLGAYTGPIRRELHLSDGRCGFV